MKPLLYLLPLFLLFGCTQKRTNTFPQSITKTINRRKTKTIHKVSTHHSNDIKQQQLTDFIPTGYKLFDKVFGDLNHDSVKDCVLMIKATRKDAFFKDEYQGVLDRNRRGIIVLLKKNGRYEVAVENNNCFSSEYEDGGAYYAPEMWIEIRHNKLYVHYAHGRYGYWEYCFRYQNSDFPLIGFKHSQDNGPIEEMITSINFLTRIKYVDRNLNAYVQRDDETIEDNFQHTAIKLAKEPLLMLSEIEDFDELVLKFS